MTPYTDPSAGCGHPLSRPRHQCSIAGALATLVSLTLLMLTAPLAWPAENLLGGEDPLSPQEAFTPSVSAVDHARITLHFDIADGYYLYRDKTSFEAQDINPPTGGAPVDPARLLLMAPEFPAAIMVDDEFFGEQAIYRNSADIGLPYTADPFTREFSLAVTYQGCADIGLCYPPTTVSVSVELPRSIDAATPGRTLSSPVVGTPSSRGLFDAASTQGELLPPELAYLPQVTRADDRQVTVRWLIEPGYYLYRDKLSFALDAAGGAGVASVDIDRGVEQHDEFFGTVEVLRESAEARLSLAPTVRPADAANASLQINYQGCADIGVCFPPSTTTLPLSFDSTPSESDSPATGITGAIGTQSATATEQRARTATGSAERTIATAQEQSEQDRLYAMLGGSSLWLNVATFFGLGLLLAFTPCVLPMIPILSSLIVGQGASMTTGRAFRLSLVYVLVMASTYAVVGVVVGLSGYNVQAFLQNPWVLSVIAVLFVLLSLSMFGFYELQIPTGLQARLTQWSNRQGGGQYSGVAAMGFISTLIVGPCVTAPLAGALIYIARTGDALIGGAALFALGLGMGAPLLLIGTSAGKFLPRAGAWMNTTKYIFGILLLGMAVYLLSRFLPGPVTMALFGLLALMSGVHLGATDTLDKDSSGMHRFGKGSGIVIALYGLALLIGAMAGSNSYLTPLRGITTASSGPGASEADHGLQFAAVKGIDGLQQVVSEASSRNRPVMLDFYADWCISCKEMEAFTFSDSRVQSLLKNAVLVQADVTANDDADKALLKKFDLFGPPGIIFYDVSGQELPAARVIGFMNAEKFGSHVQRFIGSPAN
ncbi:MAG: protein-disulfide reductase DsbD [Granulosicoccus sp.]|nr:protein-disulfide reductase DsbD [Granulosicoccus sp.]